jgi:lipoprotein signal peptidase
MPANKAKWKPVAFCGLSILILDLVSKAIVQDYINPWEPLVVIQGFFNLILTYNSGVAFSIFAGDGEGGHAWMLISLSLFSLLPFIYFYLKATPDDRLCLYGLGLVWGGALGNIHDRLRWGAVVDFIDLYWGAWHWPAFNVADMAICFGVGFLALSILREKPKKNLN